MKTESLQSNGNAHFDQNKMTLSDALEMAKYYSLLIGALAALGYMLLLVE